MAQITVGVGLIVMGTGEGEVDGVGATPEEGRREMGVLDGVATAFQIKYSGEYLERGGEGSAFLTC
jgi:hypothetical protein